ncbi:hypothetical protein C3F42_05140 [Pseudomonas sp. PONIH3]|nr:hypothetical protein C3F42_05140 [Pseudomonas sp. PONIH3]
MARVAGDTGRVTCKTVEKRMPKQLVPTAAMSTLISDHFEAGRSKVRRTHRGHPMPSAIALTSAHWSNCEFVP